MTSQTILTIAEVNTLLAGTSVSPITMPVRKSPKGKVVSVKSAPKLSERQIKMAGLKPSLSQCKRINRALAKQDIDGFTWGDFKAAFPTMLDASNYYTRLTAV